MVVNYLFQVKNPKVQKSTKSHTVGNFIFLTEFKINAKVQKSKSPTLQTAHSD